MTHLVTNEAGHLLDLDDGPSRVIAAIYGGVRPVKPRPPRKRALLWVRRGRTLIAHRDNRTIVVRPDGTLIRRVDR